jgi:hypothetical protein
MQAKGLILARYIIYDPLFDFAKRQRGIDNLYARALAE